jgi:hypothetical protein
VEPEDESGKWPAGPWRGYYLYAPGGVRHRQELSLAFRDGVMTGDGVDGVGSFIVRGHYDPLTHEAHWTKSYLGRHTVYYRGFREGKGIWGTWVIHAALHGGFRIWPRGVSEDEELAAEAAAETPVVAKAIVPAPPPGKTSGPPAAPGS